MLPKHAELVDTYLASIREIFEKLFVDENFLTLLEAEGMTTIPAYLNPLLQEARSCHAVY
jgi:hypothetical protein